jgi:hypothetical protein
MNITETKLRSIIHEIVMNEWIADQSVPPPAKSGEDASEETKPKEMTQVDESIVKAAIKKGDAAHEDIKNDMKIRYGPALIKAAAVETDKELAAFIKDNPGIEKASDISPGKLTEIKRAATKQAITEFRAEYSDDAVIGAYVDDIARRMGYSATPPSAEALFKRYMYDFTYQFVFGFIDNFVLVVAGAVLDAMLAKRFGESGYSGLIGAAIGNLISDIMGDLGGVAIEDAITSADWVQGMATDEEIKLSAPYMETLMSSATTTGVAAGCIVGAVAGFFVVGLIGKIALSAALASSTPEVVAAAEAAVAAKGATVTMFNAAMSAVITTTTVTVGAIALLVTAGILGTRWKLTQNVLDELTMDFMTNSNREFKLGLMKLYNEGETEYTFTVGDKESGEDETIKVDKWTEALPEYLQIALASEMVKDRQSDTQRIWNREMSLSAFTGTPDLNKNMIFEYVSGVSKALGLTDPNAGIVINESRWQKLAGII